LRFFAFFLRGVLLPPSIDIVRGTTYPP
jgi:hypothetical protein